MQQRNPQDHYAYMLSQWNYDALCSKKASLPLWFDKSRDLIVAFRTSVKWHLTLLLALTLKLFLKQPPRDTKFSVVYIWHIVLTDQFWAKFLQVTEQTFQSVNINIYMFSKNVKVIFIEVKTGKPEDCRDFPLFLPPYPMHLGFTYKAMSYKYSYLLTYFTYIQLYLHTLLTSSCNLAGRAEPVYTLHLCKHIGSAEWYVHIYSHFCINLQL